MNKYIDADKLIAEIERQIDYSSKRIHPGKNDGTSTHYRGEVTALFTIKSVVTSLQQEQPLTIKQVVEQCKKFGGNPEVIQQEQPEADFFDEILDVFDANCKLPPRSEEELTMLETIARHFYELGLNARKK